MDVVTVVLCTRDRPKQVIHAVRTLLDTSADHIEVILVDQSDQDASEVALKSFAGDSRFCYRRSKTRGKGAGLNEGMRLARGGIVVLTDDDCLVPKDWAAHMAERLASEPRAAVLFCNLVPVPHDSTLGYVPAYERTTPRTLTGLGQLRDGLGLGAAMAVRVDVALALNGFDERFGPGARFPSADEWDFCVRALLKGYHVVETPELSVVHDGFRSAAEGRVHTARDWKALGALSSKVVRARSIGALGPLEFFARKALLPPLHDLLSLRRPRGLMRITPFMQGFAEGMRTPLDPESMKFR
jgi:GT2 family glycosyltransferase